MLLLLDGCGHKPRANTDDSRGARPGAGPQRQTASSIVGAGQPDNLDGRLSAFLADVSTTSPELGASETTMLRVLSRALGVSVQLNAPRSNGGQIILYVVDREKMALHPLAGGAANDCALVPIDDRDVCEVVDEVVDNCAVVSAHNIACDVALVWRLNRYAAALAISSSKDKETGKYPFPREDIRLTFADAEAKYTSTGARLANIATLDDSFEHKFSYVDDVRVRVREGFFEFLLYHEAGHVLNRDVAGAVLPRCALSKWTISQLCAPEDPAEVQADAVALRLLSAGLKPNEFTPERAAPELFIEEYERRVYRAIKAVGGDPRRWVEPTAGEQREAYESAWLDEVSTGSHPQDLRRYIRMMKILVDRGITLSASKKTVLDASSTIERIDSFCHKT